MNLKFLNFIEFLILFFINFFIYTDAGDYPATSLLNANAPWATFRRNEYGLSSSPFGIGTDGTLKWKTLVGGSYLQSSPTVGRDGTIYVASDDSNVYAINSDGTTKWSVQPGTDYWMTAPTLSSTGVLYVGCRNNYVYALNATDGNKLWEYQSGDMIYSISIAISDDGTLYFQSDDFKIYALNPDGTEKWAQPYDTGGAGVPFLVSSPVVNNALNELIVGTMDSKIVKLNADTGSLITSQNLPANVYSTPTIDPSDNSIIFGCNDQNVYALNADLSDKWTASGSFGDWIISSAAIGDTMVFIGGKDDHMYGMHRETGTRVWAKDTSAAIYSSPAVGGNNTRVYFGSLDNYFYCLDADTGTQIWRYLTGGEIWSSPAIGSDGTVYTTSKDGYLYAFTATNDYCSSFSNTEPWDYTATAHSPDCYAARGAYGGGDVNTDCETCPTGTYSNYPGATYCSSCTDGAVTLSTGAVSPDDCHICADGTHYVESGSCESCPIGTYADPEDNACLDCSWPTWTIRDRQTTCDAIHLNFHDWFKAISITYCAGLWVYAICMVDRKNRFDVAMYLFLPDFNYFTDFSYLIYSIFYNPLIFVLILGFFLMPVILFVMKLRKKKEVLREFYPFFMPRVWILGSIDQNLTILDKDVDLSINSASTLCSGIFITFKKVMSRAFVLGNKEDNPLILDSEDGSQITSAEACWKYAYISLLWFLLFLPQVVLMITYFFWDFPRICFASLMVLSGGFLTSTHLMGIRKVNNQWHQLWTGTDEFIDSGEGDIIVELMVESRYLQFTEFPQFILQIANNTMVGGNWTGLAITSIFMTSYMCIEGFYQVAYHLFYLKLSLKELSDWGLEGGIPFIYWVHLTGDGGVEHHTDDRIKKLMDGSLRNEILAPKAEDERGASAANTLRDNLLKDPSLRSTIMKAAQEVVNKAFEADKNPSTISAIFLYAEKAAGRTPFNFKSFDKTPNVVSLDSDQLILLQNELNSQDKAIISQFILLRDLDNST